MSRFVFDVSHTLGINNGHCNGNGNGNGRAKKKPQAELPQPTEGYITLVVPKGIHLKSIRESPLGGEFLKPQEWYERRKEYEWAARPGIWLFRICSDIRFERFNDIAPVLRQSDELPPHPALALAAILCLAASGEDILANRFLSTCLMEEGGVLQIGRPTQKVELISFQDRFDSLSVAAAAKLVK